MPNITITNVDLGSVIEQNARFRDEILAVAAADTILEGTILARRNVATAVAVAADGGNTGNTVVSDVTVQTNDLPAGDYSLIVAADGTLGASLGTWYLVGPDGQNLIAPLTLGPSPQTLNAGGFEITITEGATKATAGDTYTLTVAADGDLVPFATDGVGGAGIPLAILTYEVVTTAAEDVAVRAGVSGSYRKERLVIDGSAAGVGITNAIIDQLRDYGLVPIDVTELGLLDNQP